MSGCLAVQDLTHSIHSAPTPHDGIPKTCTCLWDSLLLSLWSQCRVSDHIAVRQWRDLNGYGKDTNVLRRSSRRGERFETGTGLRPVLYAVDQVPR
jgi:hypothetical protein